MIRMVLRPHNLMEPEETVGNLWHDYARSIGAAPEHHGAAAELTLVRPSLAVLFRALGGAQGVEIVEAPAVHSPHRRAIKRQIGTAREVQPVAGFDGERLRLPPRIACFDRNDLNRAAYFWLTALAAMAHETLPDTSDALHHDCAQITHNAAVADRAFKSCPGLRNAYRAMCDQVLANRAKPTLPRDEAMIEAAIRAQLNGDSAQLDVTRSTRRYMPFQPVPIWLHFGHANTGDTADAATDTTAPPPTAAMTNRKVGLRKDTSEANRRDSIIIHRFESILSWVESMNLNRSVDDDDDEHAQKAAEDQDNITLSKVDKRAATRLRLHLDLSPAEADQERVAGKFTYPEWNYRQRSYMADHCRVLETPPEPATDAFQPNQKQIDAVRKQFEALRPRRVIRPRQLDGAELDLDAVISAQVELRASGHASDRIYQSARQIERDLAVAFLIDTSRSTEAAVDDTSVIDTARDALSALAGGIDACGDRLGIWGFSSLRRDRVFLTCCKSFDDPMTDQTIANICALKPGHYTRLGAAIRHASARLAEQNAARKLLIVLTDGKPNDLDHYEGQHGIEDSHMAVRDARNLGQSVYGVIIDEDGQDWFARIFGRGGFTLLPHPARLPRVLPDIYRSLTQET